MPKLTKFIINLYKKCGHLYELKSVFYDLAHKARVYANQKVSNPEDQMLHLVIRAKGGGPSP